MRSVGVLVLAVVLGHDFGSQYGSENFDCEESVVEFAVDGFHERVQTGSAWFDEY